MKVIIKNMTSDQCKSLVKKEFNVQGLYQITVGLGTVDILEAISIQQYTELKLCLAKAGYELLDNKKNALVDKIKNIIADLVCHSDAPLETNFSEYLSRKLKYDYTYMSNVFSKEEGISIEKYTINYKINRVKELIAYDNLNLTEISRKLHYSSVAHLSYQFKKITGLTPSFFKQLQNNSKPVEHKMCE